MKVTLVAFGIAKDILGRRQLEWELEESTQISDLKKGLMARFPDFSELQSLRFAVNEDYQDDDYQLQPKDEVVIIPPVSGG